jgi:integrase
MTMSERRGHNDGTIVERKNKNGDVTGYQAQISVAGGRRSRTSKTKAEARRWMVQAKSDAARGQLAARRPPTLKTYLQNTWLATIADKVKPRTQASYTLNAKRIPEWLGSLRLDELKRAHFQRFYTELTKQGLAPRTVRQVHMTLHKALEDALRLELVSRNPTEALELPRVPQKETTWYNDQQLVRLFEATEGDRFHALWVTLGTLGLRLGEALGLKWSDIDWTRGTITIRRTLQRNRLTGTLEFREPKTAQSRRTLSLPKQTVAALRAHHDRQDFDRRKVGDVCQETGLVFCTGFGTPLDQGRIHYNWTNATTVSGLPRYRIHDLRHSFASNLIAGGMGLLEVAHLLGHTDATMVMRVYGHVAPDDQGRAALLMDALLSRHASVAWS